MLKWLPIALCCAALAQALAAQAGGASASRRLPREAVTVVLTSRLPAGCHVACVYVGDARLGNAIVLDRLAADSTWVVAAVFTYLITTELSENGARAAGGAVQVGAPTNPNILGARTLATAGRLLRRTRADPAIQHEWLGPARVARVYLPRGYFQAGGRLYRTPPPWLGRE